MAFILQATETLKQTLKQAEGASVEKIPKQGVDTTPKQTVDVTLKLGWALPNVALWLYTIVVILTKQNFQWDV